jgi:hypothetical protein
MKVYRATFSWPLHQLEVSGQIHDPAALTLGKEPLVPILEEAVLSLRVGPENVEKRKFLALQRLELRPLYYQVRNQSLYRLCYPVSLN